MEESLQNIHTLHVKQACTGCRVRRLCLPVSLDNTAVQTLAQLVKRRAPLKRGEHLYHSGDRFTSLYAIQVGSLKTYGITLEGTVQVTGFHLSGELVGMDAIDNLVHPCSAVALENTWVCELPFNQLETLALQVPSLQHEIMRLMSRQIRDESNALMMMGKVSAEVRLVRFLRNLHQRMRKRLGNIDEIHLPMTREDIANYLGLTPETVSRVFTRLRSEGIITVRNRRLKFVNMRAVEQLAS